MKLYIRLIQLSAILLLVLLALLVLVVPGRGVSVGNSNPVLPTIPNGVAIHPLQTAPVVRILFAGDMMLDRAVHDRAVQFGTVALYRNVLPLFLGNDLNILNLEGTITDNESIAQKDHTRLQFTFDPGLAHEVLQGLKVSAVTLANNHTLDFGAKGLFDTRRYLNGFGVSSFGSPTNATSSVSLKMVVNGKIFCFVGYSQFRRPDPAPVVSDIASSKQICYRTVVFAHWGEEYYATWTPLQESLAHAFVDAGADLVIGAHPHVVEPLEIYKGKAIFYSLGNFIFDQDFSFETMHSLSVVVDFSDTSTKYTLAPLAIKRAEVSLALSPDKERVLDMLVGTSTLPFVVKNDVRTTSTFTLLRK